MKNIVIIGGGAAGMKCAISAAYKYKDGSAEITVFEKNIRPLRKVMITGKGRCNVTNNCDVDAAIANVPRNPRFLYSAFSVFSPKETMAFFESVGVPLKTERGNRVFPVSDKAVDIVDALVKTAKAAGVKIVNAAVAEVLCENGAVTAVKATDGRSFSADSVVIATGGASYSVTGSTGDGYTISKALGHTVTEISGSLVPMECHEGFCSRLSGLSLKNVTLSLFESGKKKAVYSEMGEMLFTHFGISGPLVLSASAFVNGGKDYRVLIDLKPALSTEQLDNRILRDFSELQNKDFRNSLDALLPKSLIPVIISLSGIEAYKKVNQISKEERLRLCEVIKKFPLKITSLRPVDEAIITRGGVSVKEINPATMESKLVKGLFFAGEVIDVDAFTGGFNLQIAFSTGYLAGQNL